ncbi:hypothetical protein RMCBS344292_04745 [Rhizopus microsporus]|nr:hypothetical protein RMCBS344292_04745 [Rhizopus microsporus]
MFNGNKQKNKQDYIVKLWSQLLERLVRNSDLRLKWGKSGFARIEYSSYMADVRVLVDHQDDEYETMCAEATKSSPSKAKFHHDHCKLLIESKDVLDNSPVVVSHIPAVQFCGHELYEFELVHYADYFYVARKTPYAFVPPTIEITREVLVEFLMRDVERRATKAFNANLIVLSDDEDDQGLRLTVIEGQLQDIPIQEIENEDFQEQANGEQDEIEQSRAIGEE